MLSIPKIPECSQQQQQNHQRDLQDKQQSKPPPPSSQEKAGSGLLSCRSGMQILPFDSSSAWITATGRLLLGSPQITANLLSRHKEPNAYCQCLTTVRSHGYHLTADTGTYALCEQAADGAYSIPGDSLLVRFSSA